MPGWKILLLFLALLPSGTYINYLFLVCFVLFAGLGAMHFFSKTEQGLEPTYQMPYAWLSSLFGYAAAGLAMSHGVGMILEMV